MTPAFSAYADITSDTPQLSDEPAISDLPDLPGSTEIGGGSSSASGNSSSGSGSSTSGTSSGGAVITDVPSLGGGTSSGTSSTGTSSSGTSNTAAKGGKAVDKPAGSQTEQETETLAKDITELSDTPSSTGKSKSGEITSAPATGKTNHASEAPVAEKSAKDTAAQTSQQNTKASVAVGPSSAAKSQGIGSVYANDPVTRVNLDFSLITPNHVKGDLHVARGCVQLTDGSWQTFEYKDNIHYAFFKMKDTRTDSSGTTWYIATVKARRFGDAAAKDGEYKTELWLNASDCTTRSTIDINTTSEKRIAIVKAALSQLGKKYTYGAAGPDAFDCSALVKYVCAQAGISVPRTSTQLLQLNGQITAAELRPGDILARAGHCGIYIGNGIFVHASDSSVGVVAEYLSVYNLSNKFTNYINVVGD